MFILFVFVRFDVSVTVVDDLLVQTIQKDTLTKLRTYLSSINDWAMAGRHQLGFLWFNTGSPTVTRLKLRIVSLTIRITYK